MAKTGSYLSLYQQNDRISKTNWVYWHKTWLGLTLMDNTPNSFQVFCEETQYSWTFLVVLHVMLLCLLYTSKLVVCYACLFLLGISMQCTGCYFRYLD